MNILEVFLQFGTVFVGAFLAFVLENLRERQQLKGWANDYLKRVREGLTRADDQDNATELRRVAAAYASFVSADREPHETPNEGEWNSLMWLWFKRYENHAALTETAASRALPAEVTQALTALDDAGRGVEMMSDFCHSAWQQYTLPLALRQTPPTDAELRGLAYVGELLTLASKWEDERNKRETEVLRLLDTHDLGR